jgi:inhibitor of cysteine peptidase
MGMRDLCVATALALAVAGCASGPKKAEVGARDDDRTVELKPGDELLVKLESNRTTRFRWVLTEGPGKVLFKQGDPTYARPIDSAPGAGGTETWSFRAVEPGEQSLVFEYRRPSDKTAEKTVRYKVTVR